jgi:hypothetical protein
MTDCGLAVRTNISDETEAHHLASIEMTHSHRSSHDYPQQSRSRLVVDDLSAQLAPLQMYGLAKLTSAVVDGLVVLAAGSRKGLRQGGLDPFDFGGRGGDLGHSSAVAPSGLGGMGRERSRRL